MVEILYDVVKAIAGEDISICAQITDVNGANIENSCSLVFLDKDFEQIAEYDGTYTDGMWVFVIPAIATKGLEGRYWYRIKYKNGSMSFAAPIYMGV